MGKGPHSPGARAPRTEAGAEKRWKGTTRSQKVEAHATRILEIWQQRISMRPTEVKAMLRREFGVGQTAADLALSRAYELYAERANDPELVNVLAAKYLDLAEQAERQGRPNDARKVLDSLRAHLGIGSPDRVEHSGSVGVTRDEAMAPLTDEELAVLAKLDSSVHGVGDGDGGAH